MKSIEPWPCGDWPPAVGPFGDTWAKWTCWVWWPPMWCICWEWEKNEVDCCDPLLKALPLTFWIWPVAILSRCTSSRSASFRAVEATIMIKKPENYENCFALLSSPGETMDSIICLFVCSMILECRMSQNKMATCSAPLRKYLITGTISFLILQFSLAGYMCALLGSISKMMLCWVRSEVV